MPLRNAPSLKKPWSTATSKQRPSAANRRLSLGSMTASLSGSCSFGRGGGPLVKRHVLIVLLGLAAVAAPAQAASPGAAGLGDRLFPLGNGGYDVQHYDLDLRYATCGAVAGDRRHGDDRSRAPRSRCRASTSTSPATRSATYGQRPPARSAPRRRGAGDHAASARCSKGPPFVVRGRALHGASDRAGPERPARRAVLHHPGRLGDRGPARPARTASSRPTTTRATRRRSRFRFDVPAGEAAFANGVLAGTTARGGRTIWTLPAAPADGDRADRSSPSAAMT